MPAEAATVTDVVPSLNVTVALLTSPSMPEVVKATAPFSPLLIVVSPIDSVRSPPASAVVSSVIAAPLADAVLPAASVTWSTELTGPSARVDRSAMPAEAATVTDVVPSLNVTVALLTSPSMPEVVKATAPFSPLLMVVSPIDSVRLPSASAVVSSVKSSALEFDDALPAASVWRTITLWAPSPLTVKLEPLPAVQFVPPSVLYCQAAPASSPPTLTVPSLVRLSPELPLSVARDSVGAATCVSSVIAAPLADAVLPAASVTWSTELTGPSARVDRSAVPAEAATVTDVVPSLNVTVALLTSPSMPEVVKATAPFSPLLIDVSPIDSARSPPHVRRGVEREVERARRSTTRCPPHRSGGRSRSGRHRRSA